MYLVFSEFTSRPIFLLASYRSEVYVEINFKLSTTTISSLSFTHARDEPLQQIKILEVK
jgi:hypothetical protein